MRRVRAAADESTSAVADSLRPSTNRVYEAHKFIAASDPGNREPSTAGVLEVGPEQRIRR